jgi:hypothetical protein
MICNPLAPLNVLMYTFATFEYTHSETLPTPASLPCLVEASLPPPAHLYVRPTQSTSAKQSSKVLIHPRDTRTDPRGTVIHLTGGGQINTSKGQPCGLGDLALQRHQPMKAGYCLLAALVASLGRQAIALQYVSEIASWSLTD